jgi:hypothetical protein
MTLTVRRAGLRLLWIAPIHPSQRMWSGRGAGTGYWAGRYNGHLRGSPALEIKEDRRGENPCEADI